jgi:hypothetical protein
LALVYTYANAVAVYAGETRFWEERRQASRRLKNEGPASDPGFPDSSLTAEQRQLLAQLPAARQMDFRVTEPATLSGSVTAGRASGRSFEQADLAHIPSWISSLVLPYAAVRDIYIAPKPGAPLVIHVQDAHGIEEAQRNIAGLIESLRQERGISLVGLEGAAGAFALEPFRAYPDPAVTKAIADFFLKDATITGAEYAGLTSTAPPLLWGIEDQTRYEENIQAFQDSLKNKPAVGAFLGPLEAAAAALKEKIYSPALKEFDKRCRAYQDRDSGLGGYVGYLMSAYPGDKTRFPNLRLLTEALTWEENLDFKRVEKDRLKLVEALARRLPEKSLNVLVQQSLLYRAGRMTYGDYYRFLRSLCASNRIPLSDFGTLGDYITYILIAERINRNDLLDELFRMETAVQDALAATVPEKRLVEASRSLILLEKLTSHAMTPADWAAYQSNRKQVLSAPLELKVVAMGLPASSPSPSMAAPTRHFSLAQSGEGRGEGGIAVPSRPPDFEALLTPFEKFCSYALERNNALVENLLVKMTAEKTPAAILVAGGFHTDGLTQVFRRKDVSYVVVTPKITDIPKENKYLDVFARDAVPLEKLFEGDKINLVAAQVNSLSSLSTVRSHYYRALTVVLRHLLKPLSSEDAHALALRIPGIVDADFDGNIVSIRFRGEESSRVFRTKGERGRQVDLDFDGAKVSTRVEAVRPNAAAAFFRALPRRVASVNWRRLAGRAVLPAMVGAAVGGGLALLIGYARNHPIPIAVIGPIIVYLVVFGLIAMTFLLIYAAASGRTLDLAVVRQNIGRWVSGLVPPKVQGFFMGRRRPSSAGGRNGSPVTLTPGPVSPSRGGVGSEFDEAFTKALKGGEGGVSSRGPPEKLNDVLRGEMDNERDVSEALHSEDPDAILRTVGAMADFDERVLLPVVGDRLTSGGRHVRLSDERCVEDLIKKGGFDLARFAPPIMDLNSIGGQRFGQRLGNEALDLLEREFEKVFRDEGKGDAESAEIDLGSYRESTHIVLRGVDEAKMREVVPGVWNRVLDMLIEKYRSEGLEGPLEKLRNKKYAAHVHYELPTPINIRDVFMERSKSDPWCPKEFSMDGFRAYLERDLETRKNSYMGQRKLGLDEGTAQILAEDDLRQDKRLLVGLKIWDRLNKAAVLNMLITGTTDAKDKAGFQNQRSSARREAVALAMSMVLEVNVKTVEAVNAIEKIGDERRGWLKKAALDRGLMSADERDWTEWYLPGTLTRGAKIYFMGHPGGFDMLKDLNEAYSNARGKAIPSGEYPTGRIPRLGNMMDELSEGRFGLKRIQEALGLYKEALTRCRETPTPDNVQSLLERLESLKSMLTLYRRMKGVMIERAYRDLRFHGIERQSGATHMNMTFMFSKAFAYKEEYFPEVSEALTDGTLELWRESLINSGDDELRRLGENISTGLLLAKKSGGDEMSLLASVGAAGVAPVAMEYNGLNAWNNAVAKNPKRNPKDAEMDGEFHRGLEKGLLDDSAESIRNGQATPEQLREFLKKFNQHIQEEGNSDFPFSLTVKPPDEFRDKEGRMPLVVTPDGEYFALGQEGVYKVDASTWKVIPGAVKKPPETYRSVKDLLRATVTIGGPVKGRDPIKSLREEVIPANDIQKYQRLEEGQNDADRFSGGVRTVAEVRAEQTRREHERREPAASAKSPKTLSLPFWTRVFGPVADTAVFKVGAAPWLELLLLPGIAVVLSHFLPMWFAILAGSLIMSALHGLPPVGQRGPPGQTWFEFLVRAVMAAFIAWGAFHAGGFSPEMLSAVLHHPLAASSWVSLPPTLLGAGLLHVFFNFWMVLVEGPTLSMSRKTPPSLPAISTKTGNALLDELVLLLSGRHRGVNEIFRLIAGLDQGHGNLKAEDILLATEVAKEGGDLPSVLASLLLGQGEGVRRMALTDCSVEREVSARLQVLDAVNKLPSASELDPRQESAFEDYMLAVLSLLGGPAETNDEDVLRSRLNDLKPEELLRILVLKQDVEMASAKSDAERKRIQRAIERVYVPLAESFGLDQWTRRSRDNVLKASSLGQWEDANKLEQALSRRNLGVDSETELESLRKGLEEYLNSFGGVRVVSREKSLASLARKASNPKESGIRDFYGLAVVWDSPWEVTDQEFRRLTGTVDAFFTARGLKHTKSGSHGGADYRDWKFNYPGSIEVQVYTKHNYFAYKMGERAHWKYGVWREEDGERQRFTRHIGMVSGDFAHDIREAVVNARRETIVFARKDPSTVATVAIPADAIPFDVAAHASINFDFDKLDKPYVGWEEESKRGWKFREENGVLRTGMVLVLSSNRTAPNLSNIRPQTFRGKLMAGRLIAQKKRGRGQGEKISSRWLGRERLVWERFAKPRGFRTVVELDEWLDRLSDPDRSEMVQEISLAAGSFNRVVRESDSDSGGRIYSITMTDRPGLVESIEDLFEGRGLPVGGCSVEKYDSSGHAIIKLELRPVGKDKGAILSDTEIMLQTLPSPPPLSGGTVPLLVGLRSNVKFDASLRSALESSGGKVEVEDVPHFDAAGIDTGKMSEDNEILKWIFETYGKGFPRTTSAPIPVAAMLNHALLDLNFAVQFNHLRRGPDGRPMPLPLNTLSRMTGVQLMENNAELIRNGMEDGFFKEVSAAGNYRWFRVNVPAEWIFRGEERNRVGQQWFERTVKAKWKERTQSEGSLHVRIRVAGRPSAQVEAQTPPRPEKPRRKSREYKNEGPKGKWGGGHARDVGLLMLVALLTHVVWPFSPGLVVAIDLMAVIGLLSELRGWGEGRALINLNKVFDALKGWQALRAEAKAPAAQSAAPAAVLTDIDFRQAAEALAEVTAPAAPVTDNLQRMVHDAVDKNDARFLDADQLGLEPDLLAGSDGKTTIIPILDLRKGTKMADAVARLRPLLGAGHNVGGVIVVGEDAVARSAALEALEAEGVAVGKIHLRTPPTRVQAGGVLFVEDVADDLPQWESLVQSGFANVKFPVISRSAGQWTARDQRLKAATVLLQILGDKLLRISVDAAESIRQEALRLSHA